MAENTYVPYDYIPVIDSTISGSIEKDNLTLTFCIPKTDILSTGIVIKMQNPITGASLLKEELLYKSRDSFIEEAITESSTLMRFKVNIPKEDLISSISVGDSYQCWVRMTQVKPQELQCNHEWSDWTPAEGQKHRRICPRCGKREYQPCEFEGSTEIIKNETTHTQNCSICKGNGIAEEHSGSFYLYTKTRHKRVCEICSWVTDEAHSFVYDYVNEKTHNCFCSICKNTQENLSVLDILDKHVDKITKNEQGEVISNSPDKFCDLCGGDYVLGDAQFIAAEDDPSVLSKIIISGSAIEEIIIPKEFKTISSNVIASDIEGATDDDIQAIKNSIKSIIFDIDSVCERIEENAFGYCEQLSLIDLPDTIKFIGKYAFTNSNQEGVSGFKVIYDGPEAWWNAITTTSPWAPKSYIKELTPIESQGLIFASQVDGTVKISGIGSWTPNSSNNYQLVIPKHYNNKPVVEVSTKVFASLSNLKSVYIPSQLQIIKAGVFSESGLTIINVSSRSNLHTIEEEAFLKNNLTQIDFSKCIKLSSLQRKAFKDCINLTKVLLPDNLNEIYGDTFAFCQRIELTITNPHGAYYTTADGSLYQKTETGDVLLTAGYLMTTFVGGVIKIAPYAFAGRELKSYGIRIPDSVYEIGESAFNSCYLLWVRLPSYITTLKNYTFAHSFELKYIENLSVNINLIEVGALADCPSLEIITYTGLRKYFYYDNTRDWPNGTTKQEGWDNNTFNYRMIYKYKEPSSYTQCSYLIDANDNRYCTITGLVNGINEDLTELIIPFEIEGRMVKKINSSAFTGCYNVENIILPETLEEIGDGAFYNAGIYAPIFLNLFIPSKVKKIGIAAFAGTEELPLPYRKIKFAFDNDLLTIDRQAFAYCSNLFDLSFGEFTKLQIIEDEAFYQCLNLWKLEFPYSLQHIGEKAFAECQKLEAIIFPYDNNLDHYGNDIGIELKYIGNQAFYHCDILTRVFLTEEMVNNVLSEERKYTHKIFERSIVPTEEQRLQFIHYTSDNISFENLYLIFGQENMGTSWTTSGERTSAYDGWLYLNWGLPSIPQGEHDFSFNFQNGILTMTFLTSYNSEYLPIFFPRFIDGQPVVEIMIKNYRDNYGYCYNEFYFHDLAQKASFGSGVRSSDRSGAIFSKHSKCKDISNFDAYDISIKIINSTVEKILDSGYSAPYEWDRIVTGNGASVQWVEFKENDLIQHEDVLSSLPKDHLSSTSGARPLKHFNFPEGMELTQKTAFSWFLFPHLREFIFPAELKDWLYSYESSDIYNVWDHSWFSSYSSYPDHITVIFDNGYTTIFDRCFFNARPFSCYLPTSVISLGSKAFYVNNSDADDYHWDYRNNIIYYEGTPSQWEKITKASDTFNPNYMPQIICLRQDPPQTFRMTRTLSQRVVEEETPANEIIAYEPYSSLILQYPEGFSAWSKASVFNLIDEPKIQIDPTYLNIKRAGVISGLFSAKYDNLKWYQVQFDTGEISDRIYPKNNNVFDYTFVAPKNATSFMLIYMTKKGYYATTEQKYQLYEYVSNVQENQDIELTKVDIINNIDLGSIDMTITIHSNIGSQLGHLLIERTSLNSQFSKWETLRDIWLMVKQSYPDQQIVIQDLFAEPGVPYQYRIQFLWNEDQYRTNVFESNNYHILTAEDIYLTSKDLQMRICYNPQITGVKRNVSDTITATIGSKYPMVRRNGHQDYLTFQISGLISYNAEIFSDLNDINIIKDRDSIAGDIGEEYLDYEHNQFKNSLFFNTSLFEDYVPQYYKLLGKREQTVILEKIFRNKVMDFLYGDDIKLFKSLTEGNKFIRLTNVSFTPNQQLGRNIYSFSATATEVADCTINNYHKYLLQDSEITFSEYDYVALASGKIIEDNIVNYYVQPQELMKISEDDDGYAIVLRRDIVPGGIQ